MNKKKNQKKPSWGKINESSRKKKVFDSRGKPTKWRMKKREKLVSESKQAIKEGRNQTSTQEKANWKKEEDQV